MRTTSSWWLLQMAAQFKRRGIDVSEVFHRASIPLDVLMSPRQRIPQDQVTLLWEVAASTCADPYLGARVGRYIDVSQFPALGFSLLSAATLAEGLASIQRYQGILGEAASLRVTSTSSSMTLHFDVEGDSRSASYHSTEAALAAGVRLVRLYLGEHWQPARLVLRRQLPNDVVRRCIANADHCVGRQEALTISPQSEHHVLGRYRDLAEPAVASSPLPTTPNPEFMILLRTRIEENLAQGDVRRETIARQLNISGRTLQRRLQDMGSSYHALLESVKRERAEQCLKYAGMSLSDTAFLCGFSDVAGFQHAFKRWFGQSPGRFAKAHLQR